MRVLAAVLVLAWMGAPAPKAPVDFSGVYKVDWVLSKALTESKGLEWKVAGAAGTAARSAEAVANADVQTTIVTQSATHLLIEERLNDYHTKVALALDGSESVNVNGIITSKSKSVWKGMNLVTTGVNYLEVGTSEIARPFTTTRMLARGGNIHIESRIQIPEHRTENVSWTVLVRQKAR